MDKIRLLNKTKQLTQETTEKAIIVDSWDDIKNNDVNFHCIKGVNFVAKYNTFFRNRLFCIGCEKKCALRKKKQKSERKKYCNDHRKDKFIKKIKDLFGGDILTSKMEYIDCQTPVILTCKKHGDFSFIPSRISSQKHICPECQNEQKTNYKLENFKKHIRRNCNSNLDYDNIIDYKTFHKDCKIWCNKHGYVVMNATRIYDGSECPECRKERLSPENITSQFKKKFYSKFGYEEYNIDDCFITKLSDKITVHTQTYGDIVETANVILHRRRYPLKPYMEEYQIKRLKEKEENRIQRAKFYEERIQEMKNDAINRKIKNINEHFKNNYNIMYDKKSGNYVLKCSTHGDIEMSYESMLKHEKCPQCEKEIDLQKRREHYINRCTEVHQGKYDYSEAEYTSKSGLIKNVKCPVHGYFSMSATNHLYGHGCSKCNMSSLEEKIYVALSNNNIDFIFQYKNRAILGLQSLDFYLPEINLGIECQGVQHYEMGKNFGNNEFEFTKQQMRDIEKAEKCQKNGINLIYFANNEFNSRCKLFTKISDIVEYVTGLLSVK